MTGALLHPSAALEVERIYGWYETQAEGLGDEVLSVIEDAIARLATGRETGAPVQDDVHRFLLRRFPHALYYRLTPEGQLVVLACSSPAGWTGPS